MMNDDERMLYDEV